VHFKVPQEFLVTPDGKEAAYRQTNEGTPNVEVAPNPGLFKKHLYYPAFDISTIIGRIGRSQKVKPEDNV